MGHFLLHYLTPGICEYQGTVFDSHQYPGGSETLKRNFITIVASL